MHELDRLCDQQKNSEAIKSQVKATLNRPFIILQEYIPGISLSRISQSRILKCFDPSLPDSQDRLFTLGKLIAGDIFLNNSDRIPSHSLKEGNGGNIFFELKVDESLDEEAFRNSDDVTFTETVAVDNKCYPVVHKEGLDAYSAQVTSWITELFGDLRLIMEGEKPLPEYEYPSLRHVTRFLKE